MGTLDLDAVAQASLKHLEQMGEFTWIQPQQIAQVYLKSGRTLIWRRIPSRDGFYLAKSYEPGITPDGDF